MRHLLSPKVAVVLALLTAFTVLPAAPARAEDGSSVASEVSRFVADLLAIIVGSADNSAPQFWPGGETAQGPQVLDHEESAPQFLPNG